ncbi:MAG: hypothetical protein K0S45_2497 [Nitrospira sp.]|jgi:hypothetical protein|nr:hypothetical protein [Nitrospira sp.]
MRIAHVSPFFEEVSADADGVEGRGVAFLAKGLTRFGHDVTVFASGGSSVSGTLVPIAHQALRHYPSPKRHLSEGLAFLALEKAFSTASPFDLIHVHAGFAAFPLMRRSPVPIMATVYGPLDAPEVLKVYREFKELALVATCAEQVRQCPELNWQAIIPWNFSLQREGAFGAEPGSLVETAMAYTAVYDRVITASITRRRAVLLGYSLQEAESRLG